MTCDAQQLLIFRIPYKHGHRVQRRESECPSTNRSQDTPCSLRIPCLAKSDLVLHKPMADAVSHTGLSQIVCVPFWVFPQGLFSSLTFSHSLPDCTRAQTSPVIRSFIFRRDPRLPFRLAPIVLSTPCAVPYSAPAVGGVTFAQSGAMLPGRSILPLYFGLAGFLVRAPRCGSVDLIGGDGCNGDALRSRQSRVHTLGENTP